MSFLKKRQYKEILSEHSQLEDSSPHSTNKSTSKVLSKKDSGFSAGSIVRIKLNKFLTYDSTEVIPGPFLNVLIGPNGTGKSAVVCAICLGLAGKTNWLGRASDPKDFIRYGADKATIEIELFNPNDDSNFNIKREINKKASHWWINGRTTTQKAVEELVAGLNIQVGNLCQFLPQEKVADFARMSQQELLENTEKAVGKANLYENHQKLKGAREQARSLEQDVGKLRTELDQEKQKNARLEEDVKSFHDRKNFLQKVGVLKMKKPWLEYQVLKDQFERGKSERDKKTEALKQEKKHLLPLEKKYDILKVEKDKLEKETREMSQKIRSKAKDLTEQSQAMINKTEKIGEAQNDYDLKLKFEEARKKKLIDLQEQLKALELGLAQMDGTDALKIAKNIDKVNEELRNVSVDMTKVQTQGQALQAEIHAIKAEIRENSNQLLKIQDVNNRRLSTLRSLHANTHEAVLWLRANKSLFKHTINEPMIISLNVMRPEDARLVESHISFNDLRSFVCEDPDDLDLFMKEVKTKLKLNINAVRAPAQHINTFQPKYDISHYKKYGFERYMQSLFTCPDPVMSYLCLMYQVHSIPIGSDAIKRNTERIIAECPELNRFYGPNVQYSVKRSKYSKHVSTRNTMLKPPRALAVSIDADSEKELHRVIKESTTRQNNKEDEYRVLQKKSEELEIKINSLREQKRNHQKQRDERKNVENQIITKKQRIQQVVKEEINIEAEKQKLDYQLKTIIREKFKCLEIMKKILADCIIMAKERVRRSIKLAEQGLDFSIIETQLRNAKQKFEGLEKEVKELQENVQELKQQAREKLMEAKKKADIGYQDKQNLEEVLTARGIWEDFKNAPSNIDELDNEINRMQARAESMFQVDEKVVRDFEKRQKEIENLEKRLNDTESNRQTHQENISEIKRQWVEPLTELIQLINTKFSYFFSTLQCCGEVSLNVPENSEDYEKYGVSIKVKFRDDENLRELTAHHQSGGERSVSTVLYMMALQELTKCPFRCVDEINQGMDPNNERKIFQLVVETVCKLSASQYFLLTPKLLPDLEYDKNITVLCVYNGEEMMIDHSQWKMKDFIKRRAALQID